MMEPEKVFVKPDNTINIKCPFCNLERRVSVDKFKDTKKINKIKCACTKIFNVAFEFRRTYRKDTNLQGSYTNKSIEGDKGEIVIDNLSMGGVGFTVVHAHNIAIGNDLLVVFKLDDQDENLVSREVKVRKIQGSYIGAEFINVRTYDKYLGFYLMP